MSGDGGAGGGGSAGPVDAGVRDVARVDGDGTPSDIAADRWVPTDTPTEIATEAGSLADAAASDATFEGGPSDGAIDGTNDASRDTATLDALDANSAADARSDPTFADADAPSDSSAPDVADAGTTIQVLPFRGTPIVKPDAGAPFHSRCASDEVVTGFVARAGVQTDGIGATCSKLVGGTLSSPRNLPINGNTTGGNQVTITCPSNHAAVGIVGRYGHNTMWNEDVTTSVGLVCKNLGSSATQIVSITTQPALDSGYTSFREDCTNGRYLTDIAGEPDSNSLGYCVGQIGGECTSR
jgi:hypothetical protein